MTNKILKDGLTYDDVLVVPSYSDILPSIVSTATRFTKNINLNVPLVSAAMDTVTESKMAIAIAQEGGIGVLHKNMSIESQAIEVRKVKRSESGMILDPITLEIDALVSDAFKLMSEHKIGGIPIVDKNLSLIGIVTNRDLRFEKDMSLPISSIMTTDNLITTELSDLDNAENTGLDKRFLRNECNKLNWSYIYETHYSCSHCVRAFCYFPCLCRKLWWRKPRS